MPLTPTWTSAQATWSSFLDEALKLFAFMVAMI